MKLTKEYREKVREAILEHRDSFPSLSDKAFGQTMGISASVFSRLKKGETERIAADIFWIEQGRKLNVDLGTITWRPARTQVYEQIEDNITFCKEYQKATIMNDPCGIGKSFCTRHIVRTLNDAFYMDCSQARTKHKFIRALAQTLGMDNRGKVEDVKENLKYYIKLMNKPFIALDDAGYLNKNVFIEIIEIWNATEDRCGWMLIGDGSLRKKIERGINNEKEGQEALFNRFSEEFVSNVPPTRDEKREFYQQLVGDIANANLNNKTKIDMMVQKCLTKDRKLRHLKTLIQMEHDNEQSVNSKNPVQQAV